MPRKVPYVPKVLILATSLVAVIGLAGPARAAPSAAASRSAQTASVTLPTGDPVLLGTDARGASRATVAPVQRFGVRGSFLTTRLGADTYVIPTTAKPYLGRYLDVGLFDVTRLQRLGSGDSTLPVRIDFTGGAAPRLPGVTVTTTGGGVERGYLTAASARTFGSALATQWQADARAGWPASSAMFRHVTKVSLADGAAPPAAHPDFPMLTLVVKVLDKSGKPAPFAFAGLINVDDARKYIGFPIVINGEARVSVPVGHYAGIVGTDVFNRDGTINSQIMSVTDYTVSRNMQALTFDARKATSRVAVRTPRPAALQSLSLTWTRLARSVGALGFSFGYGPGSTVDVQPAPAARIGALHWTTVWSLAAPGYSYDLSYDATSVPADEQRTIDAFQLATVDARYFTDVPQRSALFGRLPFYPFQFTAFGELYPLSTPVRRTEWIGIDPAATWFDTLFANSTRNDPFGGYVTDDGRIYTAGSSRQADWLRPALAPGVPAATNGDQAYFCPACRTAGSMDIFLAPVTDSTPGHVGLLDAAPGGSPVARFQLFRNGTKVFDQPDSAGVGGLPVPAGAATYRIVDDTTRLGFVESTMTHTELTFRSSTTDGGPLPAGWTCPDGSMRCRILPLLAAHLDLPTSLTGVLPIGRSLATLRLGHIQGAPATAVHGVSVRTSFDGGRTWTAAPVSPAGAGRYQITITNPAAHAGDYVAVSIAAADATGGAITQTVQRAYVVSSS